MIYLSAAMTNALRMRSTASPLSIGRQPVICYELYPPDYIPPATGFDPADALELFSETSLTWLGHTYRRQVQSRGDVVRLVTSEFNRVDVTFDNTDLFMSAYVINNEVEGQRVVVRYLDRALSTSLADSVVLISGRMEKPSSLDESECGVTAMQDLASIDYEIPQRAFTPLDPKGRKPGDILYEGFQFNAVNGFFATGTVVTKRYLLFFNKKSIKKSNEQWSAETGTSRDQVVPLVFGRCQMEGIPVLWADVGFFIDGLWVFAGHKVSAIERLKTQTPGYDEITGATGPAPRPIGVPPRIHLGDIGGTGTNATVDDQFPASGAYLSRTAYVGGGIFGPDERTASFPNPGQDQVPVLTGIVKGEADLPDSIGNFTARGFTDNPAYLTRFILTDPDLCNINPALIDDEECLATARRCDEFLQDDTNAELVVMTADDAAQMADGAFERYHSSGMYNTGYYQHYLDPIGADDPWTTPVDDPTIYEIDTLPTSLAPVTHYRKRYTFNAPLTDNVKAVDFLFKTVLPSFRGYLLTGSDGRIKILTERPADSTFMRANSAAGATSIAVNDITPWLDLTVYINRAYRATWLRDATALEVDTWVTAIQTDTGINVVAAAVLMKQLLTGSEYTGRGRTDAQFVTDLYLTYLDRLGEPAGLSFWLTQVGASGRGPVMDEFGLSAEFSARTLSTGSATQGLALIGVGLITSETRAVTGAEYSTAGNSITLAASATGMTLTASGGTLSGATATAPASGTLTVSGTPNAGDQITATIQGVAVTYTLNADDTMETTAAMLAAAINANWQLKGFVRAVWNNSTIVYVYAKLGNLLLYSSPAVAVTWRNLVNCTSGGSDLTKSAGGDAWNAGGFSVEGLTGDGYIEFTGWNNTQQRMVGLSVDDPNASYETIDYAWFGNDAVGSSTAQVYQNGSVASSAFPYTSATVFKIERTGTTIKYYMDGVLKYTSAIASTGTLYVDTSIKTPASIIPSVGMNTTLGGLSYAHNAMLASPTVAPTLGASFGGPGLALGNYYVAYSWTTAVGETFVSPVAGVTVVSSGQYVHATPPALPAGAAAVKYYFSKAPNDTELAFYGSNTGGLKQIFTLPADNAALVPTSNTAGEEVIRVQASFTPENIRLGKFRWPLTGASSINQVLIKYREATEDFAERELYVNDYTHQALIKKTNKVEIDGAGIDNYHQASRIANSRLSKEREGSFFVEWDTDEAGIAFEEGDVVCATDVTGGFVNLPLRIESLRIHDNLDVSFTGRLYSTIMYSDQTGQYPITLPSTLKYLNQAPPPATNLILTQTTAYTPFPSHGVTASFDFGEFPTGQLARIYIKGPSASLASEPPDDEYRFVDTTYPDAANKGYFQIAALEFGAYWIKVQTESVLGYKAATWPVASFIQEGLTLHLYIKIAYQGALDRDPTSGEYSTAEAALTAGCGANTTLAATLTFFNAIFTSAEYLALATTDTEFIEDLYQSFFGREPEQAGWDFWTANLAGTTRAIMRDVFNGENEHITRVKRGWCGTVMQTANALQVQSIPVSKTAPSAAQVLTYDGTEWKPSAGGAATGDEVFNAEDDGFDSGTLNAKWSAFSGGTAPTVAINPKEARSCYLIKWAGSAAGYAGFSQPFAPAGDCSMTVAYKSDFKSGASTNLDMYLQNLAGSDGALARLRASAAGAIELQLINVSGSVLIGTYSVALPAAPNNSGIVVHLQRVGTTFTTLISLDGGVTWSQVATTMTKTVTISHLVLLMNQAAAPTKDRVGIDWVRRDWFFW